MKHRAGMVALWPEADSCVRSGLKLDGLAVGGGEEKPPHPCDVPLTPTPPFTCKCAYMSPRPSLGALSPADWLDPNMAPLRSNTDGSDGDGLESHRKVRGGSRIKAAPKGLR